MVRRYRGITKRGNQHGQERTTSPCGVEEPERDLGPVEGGGRGARPLSPPCSMWGHVAPGVVRQISLQSRSHELLIHKRGLPLVCITSVVKRFELTCGCALLHAVRALMCLRSPQQTRCVSPDACPKTKTKQKCLCTHVWAHHAHNR